MSEIEAKWLSYARDVLCDEDHRRECAALGGSPVHPGVDSSDLRWPGYLGRDVRVGRCVLVVSNIHRDFASGAVGAGLRDQLVTAARDWQQERISDENYLAAVRSAYATGLAGWTVGRHIRHVATALGLTTQQIAYTNAARCQFPEVPPPIPGAAGIKRRLQALCLARFPVEGLVDLLLPALVLFTSSEAYDLVSSSAESVSDPSCPMVLMHQLNGRLLRDVEVEGVRLTAPLSRQDWVPQLAGALARP